MDSRPKLHNIKYLDERRISEMTEIFRAKSKDIEAKINALSEAREQMKNAHILNQIMNVWREEAVRLRSEERDATASLNDPGFKWILEDPSVSKILDQIRNSAGEFEDIVLRPLWTMRKDLKNWIARKKDSFDVPSPDPIKHIISNIRNSVKDVQKSLFSEEFGLHTETNEMGSLFGVNHNPISPDVKEMGVPEEAWDWSTPDEGFLMILLAEFIKLDAAFFNRLESIQSEYKSIQDSFVDLTQKELDLSDYLWDIFQRLPRSGRKKLVSECFSKLFVERNKEELQEILQRCEHGNLLKERAATLKRSWFAARNDLCTRIKSTLAQSLEFAERRRIQVEEQRSQIRMYDQLHEQVRRWREEKAELAELEEREELRGLVAEQEHQAVRKSKNKSRRPRTRRKIVTHKVMKPVLKDREAGNESAHLAMLREAHAKQAKADTVCLLEAERRRLLKVKRNNQQVEEKMTSLDGHMQDRPELFRQQPLGVRQEQHIPHLGDMGDRSEEAYTGEFKQRTFPRDHLCADRRAQLISMLYSAGLFDSNYARALMGTVPSNLSTGKDKLISEEFRTSFGDK
ncbi:unnamed protein product [Calicophoron daubneyi]|uniref:Uncharacterized protein n=1 Tax=Calicophoron daubneyi TaxID=300641 RepID=A0AAV2TYW3_CALDB